MDAAEMAEYVKRIVDEASPLTEAQRARIGRIIRSARGEDAEWTQRSGPSS